jgi:hypothetical protein
MLRLRSKSTNVLFGAAFIAVSMLASPSFANIGGGNADEIPLVTNGNLVGPAQATFPTRTSSAVHKSSVCHGGYRWIQRDPYTGNGTPEEFSLPVPCK